MTERTPRQLAPEQELQPGENPEEYLQRLVDNEDGYFCIENNGVFTVVATSKVALGNKSESKTIWILISKDVPYKSVYGADYVFGITSTGAQCSSKTNRVDFNTGLGFSVPVTQQQPDYRGKLPYAMDQIYYMPKSEAQEAIKQYAEKISSVVAEARKTS